MQTEGAVLSKGLREQASFVKPLESVTASASLAPQTNLENAKAVKNSLSGMVSVYYVLLPAWYCYYC